MELSDSERAEFIALTQDSYDPDLWDDSDLPFLRAARAEHEREQERERSGLFLVTQPSLTEDDDIDPDSFRIPED
jgi:hypothetical protein